MRCWRHHSGERMAQRLTANLRAMGTTKTAKPEIVGRSATESKDPGDRVRAGRVPGKRSATPRVSAPGVRHARRAANPLGPPATAPPWNAAGAPGPGGRGSSPPTAGAIAGHDPLGESAVPEDPHEKNPARGGAPAASPAASAGGGGAGVGKGGAPAMRSISGGRES